MNLSPKIQGNILLIREEDSTVLTKDLLCFRTKRGKIQPKFIDPTAPKFLKIAFELTEHFSGSVGENRETLENRSKQVLDGFPVSVAVGRGLEKLLIDRTEFDTESKNTGEYYTNQRRRQHRAYEGPALLQD